MTQPRAGGGASKIECTPLELDPFAGLLSNAGLKQGWLHAQENDPEFESARWMGGRAFQAA